MFKLTEKMLDYLKSSFLIASIVLIVLAGVVGSYAYSREPYIVEDYVAARADAVSEYGITFELAPNDIYGTTLSYDGKKLPVYLSLLRNVVVRHSFRLLYGHASGNYSLEITLVHPDGWSKVFSQTSRAFSGEPALSSVAQLNITETRLLMESLAKQAGTRLTAYNINITAKISYTATVGSEKRGDSIAHTVILNLDISRGLAEVRGGLKENKPIIIPGRRAVPVVLAGFTVDTLRTTVPVLGLAGVVLLSAYTYLSVKTEKTPSIAELERKYRDILVEGAAPPEFSSMDVVVLKNIEELVKVARILEKPVVKASSGLDKVVYYIVDKKTVYVVEG